MNANDLLLDCSLGQLDPQQSEALDAQAARDPELALRLSRLRTALDLLLDDGAEFEPPAGLAARTVLFVDSRKRAPLKIDWLPRRVPFRMADIAVAATVLLAGLLTLAPAVVRMKAQAETTRCMNQLRQIGMGLMAYAVGNGHYPRPPANHPAGYYAIQLLKTDAIDHPVLLVCPSRQPHAELLGLSRPEDFEMRMRANPKLCLDMLEALYAYHVGYRSKDRAACPVPAHLTSIVPLMADGPPMENGRAARAGNSPNHGGAGQNVLFSDNHVEWLRTRRLPRDNDIYLNRNQIVDFGLDSGDVALIPAAWRVVD